MSDKIQYDRQFLFCDPKRARDAHVSVVGLGTVGSNVAKELVKLGVTKLHLVDPDTVEGVNLPSQHYVKADIGKSKVEATKAHLLAINADIELTEQIEYLDENSYLPSGIVVLGVDNMEARKAIMNSCRYRDDITLVVEARMSGDVLQIFTLDPTLDTDREKWDKLWYPQDESTAPTCGGQSVAYIGSMSGSLIAAIIGSYIMDKTVKFYTGITVGDFVGAQLA